MEIETITAPPATDSTKLVDAEPKKEAKQNDPGVQKAEDRKYKVKYGKEDREVSEKELIAGYQKGWASDERFKAAAAKEREVKEALEKGDLEFLVKKMKGKDLKSFAKELLIAELKKGQMTPEQLEEEERKGRIDKLRKEEEALIEKRASERKAELDRHYEELYDREFTAAIQKHGLPKNKHVMNRAIEIAEEIVVKGLEPDWDLVVGEAKRQTQEELWELLDQLDDYSIVGTDRVKKIAKWLQNSGMSKKDSEKEAVKVVKQADRKPDQAPVDENEYWEKKRKQWES